MTDRIGQHVDPDMTLSDIAKVLSQMNDSYPTPECQRLARQLATELGEVYLDKMCQHLMQAPFWNSKDPRTDG